MRIFAFVAAQKADFPVRTLCRVCKVSASGFMRTQRGWPPGRDRPRRPGRSPPRISRGSTPPHGAVTGRRG